MSEMFDFMLDYRAECSVIGGLCMNPGMCTEHISALSPKDFAHPLLSKVFSRFTDEYRKSGNINFDALLPGITADNPHETRAALARCFEAYVGFEAFRAAVNTVRENGRRGRVVNGVRETIINAHMLSADEIVAQIGDVLADSLSGSANNGIVETALLSADSFSESISKPFNREDYIFTGWPRLDKALGGLRRGTISYVGARPSVGKTTFALNAAIHNMSRMPVMLFSLEMSAEQIYERIVAWNFCGMYSKICGRELDEKHIEGARAIMGHIKKSKSPLVIDNVYTIEQIGNMIASARPRFVIVDFIQIVRTEQKYETRKAEIDYISSEFKRLAKTYGCHIMVLSQITRIGKEDPRMSDLRESGALEQDGDYIFLLHRPFVLDKRSDSGHAPEEAYVLLDKNKFGRTGIVNFRFDGEAQRFTEEGQHHV